MFGAYKRFVYKHWPYMNYAPKRTNVVQILLGKRRCESCGAYDRLYPDGTKQYLHGNGDVSFRAICLDCLLISKWRLQDGSLVRR